MHYSTKSGLMLSFKITYKSIYFKLFDSHSAPPSSQAAALGKAWHWSWDAPEPLHPSVCEVCLNPTWEAAGCPCSLSPCGSQADLSVVLPGRGTRSPSSGKQHTFPCRLAKHVLAPRSWQMDSLCQALRHFTPGWRETLPDSPRATTTLPLPSLVQLVYLLWKTMELTPYLWGTSCPLERKKLINVYVSKMKKRN